MQKIGRELKLNSFYNKEELASIGLKQVGVNVLISRNAQIYSPEKIILGDNVRIDDFCILSGKIEIGDYVHIAAYSGIYGSTEGVYINDFSNISSRVTIYAISDDFSGNSMTNPMIPEKYKKIQKSKVIIEKHVIIGSTSVVLPGVKLNEGSAFGSFSFINHSSEPWSMNVGVPCKKIGERKRNILKLEQQFWEEQKSYSNNMV